MDVQKIVRDELEKAKPDWVKDITESVTKILGDKIDSVRTILDKFVGDIETKREEQTLLKVSMTK